MKLGDQSNKADGSKTNPLLLDVDLVQSLEIVNRVLDYGAEKYERGGWRKVEPERYEAAIRRHQRAIAKGEERDGESGLLHHAHVACNALFLLQMHIDSHADEDFTTYNRPPRIHRENV